MKKFWGPGVPTLLFSACLRETVTDTLRARRFFSDIAVLVMATLFSAVSASAQDSFANAYPITGVFGSITNDNTVAVGSGGPSIAGYPPNAQLWYAWTAPQSGVVEMDTIGSVEENNQNSTNINDLGFSIPLDTVMAVYTGNSVSSLTQLAANDDLYSVFQLNETYPQSVYNVVPGTNVLGAPAPPGPIRVGGGPYGIAEYYSGPSGLRFNAVGGKTYYIAIDSKANQFNYIFGNLNEPLGIDFVGLPFGVLPSTTGPIVLNWAYQPSGVFRFATENFDLTGNLASTNSLMPPGLIPTCQTETSFSTLSDFSDHGWTVDSGQYNIQIHSYYPYNVPGVPVTITRVGGSSGRIMVTYSTQDGDTNLIVNGDQPAVANVDYTPETNQTLIFDDGEMSKTIYVPIIDNSVAVRGQGAQHPNRDFTIALTGVQADPYEDTNGDAASISPPRIDGNFGQVEVRILDVDIDPNGPANIFLVTTNPPPPATNGIVITNVVWTYEPTNPVLNFEKVNYRFPRDVTNYWKSAGNGTLVTIWVTRRGTNAGAVSADWSIDNGYLANANLGSDSTFALEPASDYANPNPPTLGSKGATNSDFSFSAYSGTVSFPTGAHAYDPQPIQFLIYNNGIATLDKDFIVDLFQTDTKTGAHIPCGMVNQTKVTILANRTPVTGETPADNRIPAGSVDENYNIDFGLKMAPPINTPVQNNPTPGTDGEVDGLVVLTNNETLAVGAFDSFNGINRYGICLIDANGNLDQSFDPGSGVNVRDGYAIDCVAQTPDNQQFVIGGSFTSYNGQSAGGVARVNLNGSLDSSFSATVNGTVYALAVQPNGQVLIGGDFNQVDGQGCNYVARLNADGSLDTTFSPGTTLNGPVYSLTALQTGTITTNVVSTTTNPQEKDTVINVSSNAVGTVNVNYIFPTGNEMQVFYGGNLIYDTGVTTTGPTTPAQFSVPYGPGNTPIVLVVNPGGSIPTGTNYSYGAAITGGVEMPEVVVGGNFNVSGQKYTDIALFSTNGGLDTSFNPTLGADQPIFAMDSQPDGKVLIGGNFQHFNSVPINRFARLNADGSLDTTNFYVGAGADDTVFSIKYNNPYTFGTRINFNGATNAIVSINRAIYIGGQFSTYNGTHRLGFARLYTDGTVDTTFMDTTYNQFAGLPKIYSYDLPGVFACGVQSDGNVMIGGNFDEVGGGEASIWPRNEIDQQEGIAQSFTNQWLWLSVAQTDEEPNARDGVRNRSNIARLVGGATPGPGNLMLVPGSSAGYQVNRNAVTEAVSLVRTNGFLGPESANFSIIPGTAQSGSDLVFQSTEPEDYLAWEYAGPTRMHTDGLQGSSGFLYDQFNDAFSGGLILLSEVNVTILPDVNVAGNLSATYQLANPANADQLYLGGEDIPVGTALGLSSSPVSLIDNSQQAGTFGFASSTFVATNLSPQITVVRKNGAYGTVNVNYSTNSPYPNGGTAMPNTDYAPISSQQLTFIQNALTNQFNLSLYNSGVVYTNFIEKTINLQLTQLRPPGNNAALGISNTTVRLINRNFQGYLTLSATNYSGLEAPPYGEISFVVNRVAGSQGSLSVQYATADGSAVHGVDYVGATNILEWNDGDVSPRIVTLALINTGVVGPSKQFSVNLSNPQLNNSSYPGLFYPGSPGSITSATMTISNNNNYGSVQFSATNYLVNENGGYATITVVRSGGVAGPAYVNYATANGTAASPANYGATSGVLTFAPNQLSASFQVPITNNGQSGPPPSGFYFNVNLSNPVNLALGTLTSAQVSILNAQSFNQPPGTTNANFVADINGTVLALSYQTNGQIIAGGSFNSVNGLTENNVVRLNSLGAVDASFAGSANSTIQAVVSQTDDRVVIGGQFTSVDGTALNYVGRLMTDGTLDSSFDVGAGGNGPVYSLVETFIGGARKIYAGGAFSAMNSVNSEGIARLNNNGTVDSSFNVGAGVDGTVYAVAVYPTNSAYAGDVLIGGSFAHFNGATVNGIARLQSNGSLDVSFNAGTAAQNGVIDALAIQPDGRVLVGGAFTNFDGNTSTNFTRLNADGSTDTNFVEIAGAGANNTVDSIVLQPDSRILVMGQFTQFGGLARNGVTRLLSNGAADPTINFGTGANGAVDTALVDPSTGLITLGGAFTAFNGASADHIIQVYGLSTTGSGGFEFSSPGYQVTANGIVAPVTILRVGGTSGPNSDGSGNIYVNFSTGAGTAVPNVDYVPVNTNVAFPPGAVMETVYVPVMTDSAASGNLNVGLLLSNPTPPAIITNQPTALLTILNVNNALSFLSGFTNIFENVPGGIVNIAVIRQGSTNGTCSVGFYTTTNGSGVPNVDFYPTNETLTFNPGVSEQNAQVLIISNSVIEKTVGMVLTNPVATALTAPTNETMTIINNSSSPGQLCFAVTNYTVNESAGTVTVYVTRTNGFAGSVSYGYTTLPGTAQPNINYVPTNGTVTFNAASTAQPITVPLLQFNPPEGPVTFSIVLTNTTTSAATLTAPTNTTVTILDDISTGVSFVNATNYVQETNGNVSILVQRLGATNGYFTVPYVMTNGTALAGTNYVPNTGPLTFAPGESFAGISVTLMNQENISNLTFGISLLPAYSVQLLSPSNTLVVETPAAAGITFTAPTNSVFKNAGSVAIPVVCLDPSNEPPILNSNSIPLSVSFSTTNGTGQAGVDYVATNGVLTFTNGIVTNWITVSIIGNSQISGLKTFGVNLSNVKPVPPGKLGTTNELITIIDNNSGLEFSSPNYSVDSGGIVTIPVLRVDNTNTISSVAFATVGGGSAIAGNDYFPTNGVLTFAPGQTTSSFNVTVIGSSSPEPDKTILMALSNPTNGILAAPSAATLTIENQNASFIVPAGVSLPASGGPPGGILQSNQQATLNFGFRDAGGANATSLHAQLLSSANITNSSSGNLNYGALLVNGPSVSKAFTFTPVGTNGQTISANFQLTVTSATNTILETNSFALTIGTLTTKWYNTNAIIFYGATNNNSAMMASPYPSIITVTNVGGVLVGATVTLTNYSDTSPQGNEVLVVAPNLSDTLLMAGVGSAQIRATSVTLTFSNGAALYLPFTNSLALPITNGVYNPTQYPSITTFP